jgi:hypothetical protein
MKSAAAAARTLVANMRAYAAPHSMMPVMPSQFAHLDLRRYDAFRRDMEQRGYRLVADVEIPEVSGMPGSVMAPTMLRVLSAADGAIVASYYQVRPRFPRRLQLLLVGLLHLRWLAAPRDFAAGLRTRHCVQLHTEFDDGSALATGNAQASGTITPPPNVERYLFPWDTPTATLLDAHRRRLDALLASNPRLRPIVVRTPGDLAAAQERQNARKAAHRAQVGLVTEEEVRRMCARFPKLAGPVYAEVVKLLAEEAASGRR